MGAQQVSSQAGRARGRRRRQRQATAGDGRRRQATPGAGRRRQAMAGDGKRRQATAGNGRRRQATAGGGRSVCHARWLEARGGHLLPLELENQRRIRSTIRISMGRGIGVTSMELAGAASGLNSESAADSTSPGPLAWVHQPGSTSLTPRERTTPTGGSRAGSACEASCPTRQLRRRVWQPRPSPDPPLSVRVPATHCCR